MDALLSFAGKVGLRTFLERADAEADPDWFRSHLPSTFPQ